MLKIKLYRNCILNETYQEVISKSHKNGTKVLELYLARLYSLEIDDIDYAYQETKGTLIFDYEIENANIYDYNYMKVECYSDDIDIPILLFTRYCFIQDIRLKNECVYLDYEEDIWSSYSDKILGTSVSYLSNSRILNYLHKTLTYRKLPIEYAGNNKLTYSNITTINNIRAVIQVQHYNLSQQGERTGRTTDYYCVELSSNTIQAFITNLTWAIKLQTEKKFYERYNYNNNQYDEDQYYFEIGKIYLVPSDFIPSSRIVQNPYTRYFIDLTSVTGYLLELQSIVPSYEFLCKTETISHNFKNKFIGTFTNQINLINNGTNHSMDFLFSKQQDGISFKLNIDNQIVDFTFDFEYEATIESISGMQASQLRISRDIAKSQATSKYVSSTLGNTVSAIGGGMKYDYYTYENPNFGRSIGGAEQIASSAINQMSNIWNYIDNMKLITANMYQTSSGIFKNNVNFVNSYYGVCLFTLNSDNDDFVKKSINEMGYEVFDYITNLEFLDFSNADYYNERNINYNTLRFSTINVYGSFPRRVAKILNSIFKKGVKIWYNENLQDDNLVVG